MKSKVAEVFGNRLRVRPSGILIENDCVLLIKHLNIGEADVFWSPPGGGQDFGESSTECLEREFLEETGLRVLCKDLLRVYEYRNHPLHALELFFEVERISGQLHQGYDPELSSEHQLIRAVQFMSLSELSTIPKVYLHPIFHDLLSWEQFREQVGYFTGPI